MRENYSGNLVDDYIFKIAENLKNKALEEYKKTRETSFRLLVRDIIDDKDSQCVNVEWMQDDENIPIGFHIHCVIWLGYVPFKDWESHIAQILRGCPLLPSNEKMKKYLEFTA